MVEAIETVVIGAGQAGLSTSYYLKQQGCEHIVLDKAAIPGNAWSEERWDSFTFVSPNWSFQVPGAEYDGPDPDGFMTRSELIRRFAAYVEKYQLPVRYNTCVTAIQQLDDGGFLVRTMETDFHARNVVAANGWFRVGKLPDFAVDIPESILKIHSNRYRSPEALPEGAVLVVGSAQSGAQIAEELYQSGRRVFLATGTAPHAPRRYRGKDFFRWMDDSGFSDQTFEQMQYLGRDFVAPMLTGRKGGYGLNLHNFHRDGVVLLGHARACLDGTLVLAPDLKQNLTKADMGQKYILKFLDGYIERAGIDAPIEEIPAAADGYQAPEILTIDLAAEKIRSIIFACGYRYDASLFQFPVLNAAGLPDAPAGVSAAHPGLYFIGFPFLPTLKSGFITGVKECAGRVTSRIAARDMGSITSRAM